MLEQPDFDIYPDVDKDIEEAEGFQAGHTPVQVAVDGLQEVVDSTISVSELGYKNAEEKVNKLFTDFPQRTPITDPDKEIHINAHIWYGKAPPQEYYSQHNTTSEILDRAKKDLEPWQQSYEKRNRISKRLFGSYEKQRMEEEAANVAKAQQLHDEKLDESSKHADDAKEDALIFNGMTERYNQIINQLGAEYGIHVKQLRPDEFLEAVDYEDIPSRDMDAGGVAAKGSGRLDWIVRDPKKQVIIMALKEIFTPEDEPEEFRGVKPMHLKERLPRKGFGMEQDEAKTEAEAMGSDYVLRVRQAVNGHLRPMNEMPGEFFIPVDNFTAALIKSLDTHSHDYNANKINDAALLDCWILYGSPDSSGRDRAYVAYDLIDLSQPEQDNLEQ